MRRRSANQRHYDRGTMPEVWSCGEIVEYVERYGATFTTVNGGQAIKWPDEIFDRYGDTLDRADIINQLTPHLAPRREELLSGWLTPQDPDAPTGEVPEDPRDIVGEEQQARRLIVLAFINRATELGKRVWLMEPPQLCPTRLDKKHIGPHVRYLCVEGDACWTILPYAEPLPFVEKKKAKHKTRRQW